MLLKLMRYPECSFLVSGQRTSLCIFCFISFVICLVRGTGCSHSMKSRRSFLREVRKATCG